jgi:hypothetical protein
MIRCGILVWLPTVAIQRETFSVEVELPTCYKGFTRVE